ncbi:MAG TPA: hypothetical protein VJP02_11290 [Candidatus Sulfotelmatobacter sp.]|nr:hypothetical protein [Candidatus Sulfotelmatobacter sp.]
MLVHVVPVLPALPSDPNYVFKVPEYERLLHNDADEKLAQLVRQIKNGTTVRVMVGHGDVADEIVRNGESRSDRDCDPWNNRLATVRVWLGCREGSAPRQVPGAHDTEPSGGRYVSGSQSSAVGSRSCPTREY